MASHTTGSASSEGQNQIPPANVKSELEPQAGDDGQTQDQKEPESELSVELESSNQALQLKLQALQRELEQTKTEISAVDHVLEVAGKSSS